MTERVSFVIQSNLKLYQANSQVFIGEFGRYPSPRGAVEEPELEEKWLVNFLNCRHLLARGGGKRIQADRPAIEFQDNYF